MSNNVMLHANNFFWQGGVPMFIHDMISVYPEFHHVIVYLHDEARFGGENFEMMDEWQIEFGCEIAKVDLLTEKLFEEVNPAVVALHSMGGDKFEGRYPYEWLRRWPIMFFHHAATKPLIPVDVDVFVSKYVLAKYDSVAKRLRNPLICPPAINVNDYTSIKRDRTSERCVIGKVCSAWNKNKYPAKLYNVMRRVGKKFPNVEFVVVGGERHNKLQELRVPRLRFIKEMSMPVSQMLEQIDIFLYINEENFPETWCRAVSEAMASGIPVVVDNFAGTAEQVADGVGGFACGTEDEFVEKLTLLIEDKRMRHDMGIQGQHKAIEKFSLERLRHDTMPYVLKALTGAI